jgi:hypothetical protein
LGDRLADAARGSGHDRHFPFECCHDDSLLEND